MPDSIETFRAAVLKELETQGVSKLELHRRTKIARTSIDGYLNEGADPGLRALDKICAALGKKPWEMLKPANFDELPKTDPTLSDVMDEIRKLSKKIDGV